MNTLIIGNGCASRSATQALITLFAELDPSFLRYNRETSNLSGLAYARVARSYYDSGEPDLLGVYAPWVVDIMPTASWVQLALAVSILFNAMGAASRFRLWRLDAARVRLEREIPLLVGPGHTVAEIAIAKPAPGLSTEDARHRAQSLSERLDALHALCRKQSLSILVPMGAEMAYRYQEVLISELIRACAGLPGTARLPDRTLE